MPLSITTPSTLPEAIAGRPYAMALAATGGRGPFRWSVDGKLPEGLTFNPSTGLLEGTPQRGTPEPLSLSIRVSDGTDLATRPVRLVVYQSDAPLVTPSWWKPRVPPIPWRLWLDHGVGFLVLWLVHMVGMGALSSSERMAEDSALDVNASGTLSLAVRRRFATYRFLVRISTLTSMTLLIVWLWAMNRA
jgi:hypothetical protein